jgi:hypothetical protein
MYSIDPVTGGPTKGQSSSSLDDMTEEEMEEEAEKLEGLLRKLDKLASVPFTVGWDGVSIKSCMALSGRSIVPEYKSSLMD